MKLCQTDKISTLISIFDDAELLYNGQDFKVIANRRQNNEISLGLNG